MTNQHTATSMGAITTTNGQIVTNHCTATSTGEKSVPGALIPQLAETKEIVQSDALVVNCSLSRNSA